MGAQRLIDMGYYGYRGWGDTEAEADFAATGGQGKGGAQPTQTSGQTSGGNVPSISGLNPIDVAREAQKFQIEANQPAIQTLQGQQEPLKQRYAQVIADIKAQQGLATKGAEIGAAREFGRRGIPLSSGAYDQFLQERTLPISTQFGGLLTQASSQEQQDLMNLVTQIAQLQAGNAPQALSTAQGLIGLQQKAQDLAFQQEQAKAAAAQPQYATLGEGQTLLNLLTGQPIYKASKTYKPESQAFNESDWD